MNAKHYQKWDTHHHMIPDFYVDEMEKLGLKKISGLQHPKWTPATSLKLMAQFNITKAFLSVSLPGVYFRDNRFSRDFARRCNTYLARLTQDHPAQFGGFASVPLPDVEGAMDELTYALDTLKLDGLVLMSNVNDKYLGSKEYREFFAEVDRRKATIFVHPNLVREDHKYLAPLYWWQNDTTRTLIDYLRSGYHREFPNIRFILSHGGGPLPVLYPRIIDQLKEENPNIEAEFSTWKSQLFLDTASKAFDEQTPALLDFAGVNHVLFGSDGGWANSMAIRAIANAVSNLDAKQGLEESQIQDIFMNNAQRTLDAASPPAQDYIPLSRPYQVMKPAIHDHVKYHFHCLPTKVAEQMQKIDAACGLETIEVWDAQKALTWMAENGVNKLMLSLDIPCLWHLKSQDRATVLRTYNDAVAMIRAEHPKSFAAFGAIDLDHIPNALSEIDYCMDELKLEGIGLYTNIAATPLESFIDSRILEKLETLQVPLLIHPRDSSGIPVANENYLDALYFMAKAFYLGIYEKHLAKTQLILTHTAGLLPYFAQPLSILGYIQVHKNDVVGYLFDAYIKKQPKGYKILMEMIEE